MDLLHFIHVELSIYCLLSGYSELRMDSCLQLIDLNVGQGEMPGGMIVDWIRAHRRAENINYDNNLYWSRRLSLSLHNITRRN